MIWINDWNDIIRHVIFSDKELMNLMKIPEKTSIIDFIDRYFIRAGFTNKILSNEDVRIVYGSTSSATNIDGVTSNVMNFDIYVKLENLHNVGVDRLVMRTQLIAQRLIYLLTRVRYNGVYRFYDPVEGDMGTSAVGYARYRVSLSYTRTY
jgi:hypothetical protein|nr:MAG TPA: hypothetical protein [Caudoviricetes sp.]DAW64129.1 MAG TPA: hypothetical protein [Caudoviricetes sp.]